MPHATICLLSALQIHDLTTEAAHAVWTRLVDGVKVRLTTALDALKDYLRKRAGSIDALVNAARADRIYPFMRPYLEALV